MIDERPREPDRILQRRRVLQPRQRRLRTQVRARVRQPPASELESGINAQSVEIVGVFVAAGNRQDAGADHVRQRVRDAQGRGDRESTAPIFPRSPTDGPPSKAASRRHPRSVARHRKPQ